MAVCGSDVGTGVRGHVARLRAALARLSWTMVLKPTESRPPEERLDSLREQARRTGHVGGTSVAIAGGPIPRDARAPAGYYGQPIVKPPVWTWQIGLYLSVGG